MLDTPLHIGHYALVAAHRVLAIEFVPMTARSKAAALLGLLCIVIAFGACSSSAQRALTSTTRLDLPDASTQTAGAFARGWTATAKQTCVGHIGTTCGLTIDARDDDAPADRTDNYVIDYRPAEDDELQNGWNVLHVFAATVGCHVADEPPQTADTVVCCE